MGTPPNGAPAPPRPAPPPAADPPGVLRAAEAVPYGPGAVVSRVLLKTPGGSATLFAFAEGEGLDEHTTPHEALVVVTEGAADVTVAGVPHRLGAGDALRLPAHVPHAVRAATAFRMLLVLLRSAAPVAPPAP